MDGFTIKTGPVTPKSYLGRDPVTVREAVETELETSKAVTPAGGQGGPQRDPHHDHAPHDVVVDPESREVINRENDVRTHETEREHPDQALLRQRAYRPQPAPEPQAPEVHANIKA